MLLLSALLFRARITLFQVLAILAGFAGVLMLMQPDPETLNMLSLLPLIAGLIYGLGMLLTPYLCGDETPVALAIGIFIAIGTISLVVLFYFSLFPAADATFLTGGWVAPTPRFFWLTSFQAVGAVKRSNNRRRPRSPVLHRSGLVRVLAGFDVKHIWRAGTTDAARQNL